MADTASLEFWVDGDLLCTLTIYVQGNGETQTPGMEPLLTVAAAQAQADGEGQVQLLEGAR